jgi:hypothetical protein
MRGRKKLTFPSRPTGWTRWTSPIAFKQFYMLASSFREASELPAHLHVLQSHRPVTNDLNDNDRLLISPVDLPIFPLFSNLWCQLGCP